MLPCISGESVAKVVRMKNIVFFIVSVSYFKLDFAGKAEKCLKKWLFQEKYVVTTIDKLKSTSIL